MKQYNNRYQSTSLPLSVTHKLVKRKRPGIKWAIRRLLGKSGYDWVWISIVPSHVNCRCAVAAP